MTIRVLQKTDAVEAKAFLFEMVEDLFAIKRNPMKHYDIFNMETFYFEENRHVLIGAFDVHNKLVGTIALKSYVDRFEAFKGKYTEQTAEVSRCYIAPKMRRKGIGNGLLQQALLIGEKIGYKNYYLHTHPNLPGGFDFWKKSGFKVFLTEDTTPQTIHMELGTL